MSLFQLVVVPAAALAATYHLVVALRARHRLVGGLLWSTVFAAIALCVAFPTIPNAVAQAVGIGRGADLVLYGTTVLLVVFIRWSYVRYRALERIHTELVRELAIERARFGAAGIANDTEQRPGGVEHRGNSRRRTA